MLMITQPPYTRVVRHTMLTMPHACQGQLVIGLQVDCHIGKVHAKMSLCEVFYIFWIVTPVALPGVTRMHALPGHHGRHDASV